MPKSSPESVIFLELILDFLPESIDMVKKRAELKISRSEIEYNCRYDRFSRAKLEYFGKVKN